MTAENHARALAVLNASIDTGSGVAFYGHGVGAALVALYAADLEMDAANKAGELVTVDTPAYDAWLARWKAAKRTRRECVAAVEKAVNRG